MNDPIKDLLSGEDSLPSYHGKNPSPEATIEFDEPMAPEGSATPPPKHLQAILEKLKPRTIDMSSPPEPTYTLNGQCWATEGNFSVFSALSKAGKSAVSGCIIASTISGEGDTMGFVSSNPLGKAVVCIDTEQSDYHHDKKMAQSLKRKGMGPWGNGDIPEWLETYALAGEILSPVWLEAIMWAAQARHGAIHSIILDGVADVVRNVNDPAESDMIVASLMKLAKEFKCHIIAIIHINPGGADSGKTRGHLGSTLERKAETNLTIKVTDRDRVVYARNARDCDIPEKKGTRFSWDEEAGMFSTAAAGANGDGFGVLDILEYIFGSADRSAGKGCLKKSFADQYGVSERTVDRHIATAKTEGSITESGTKNDRRLILTDSGVDALRANGRVEGVNPSDPE